MNIREDIKAYIDGELSEARAEQVRDAIASDASLREEYEAMQSMTTSLKGIARQPVIIGAEKAMQASRVGVGKSWKMALLTAGCLVVFASILIPVFDKSNRPSEMMASEMKEIPMTAGAPGEPTKSVDGGDFIDSAMPASVGENVGMPSKSPQVSKPKHGSSLSEGVMADREASSFIMPDARLVIKNANLNIEVEDVRSSIAKATNLTKMTGGYIEASNEGEIEGKAFGTMTLRVPQSKFETIVEELRGYGEVKGGGTSGDDVTAQVADIDARIKTLKSEEESYREILRQARRIGDILDIKERIGQVRQEIESLTAQQATLRKLSALATINLEFREAKKITDKPKPDDWLQETDVDAMLVLKSIGKFFAQIGIYLYRLAPIWIPLVILGYWLKRKGKI